VTLVEYGDFACPFCAAAYPVVRELLLHYRTSLRFVFRHNPRGGLNPGGHLAALGAEAAGRQQKFWAMHDLMFERGAPASDAELAGYAALVGLDAARFEIDLREPEVAARVHGDEVDGLRSGVVGTPAFFINGHRFRDKPDLETLFKAIGTTLLLGRRAAPSAAPGAEAVRRR
jgi:protein-disulfide isomerase